MYDINEQAKRFFSRCHCASHLNLNLVTLAPHPIRITSCSRCPTTEERVGVERLRCPPSKLVGSPTIEQRVGVGIETLRCSTELKQRVERLLRY